MFAGRKAGRGSLFSLIATLLSAIVRIGLGSCRICASPACRGRASLGSAASRQTRVYGSNCPSRRVCSIFALICGVPTSISVLCCCSSSRCVTAGKSKEGLGHRPSRWPSGYGCGATSPTLGVIWLNSSGRALSTNCCAAGCVFCYFRGATVRDAGHGACVRSRLRRLYSSRPQGRRLRAGLEQKEGADPGGQKERFKLCEATGGSSLKDQRRPKPGF